MLLLDASIAKLINISAYKVTNSVKTLFNSVAAATLTPLSAMPTQDFRIKATVTGGTANTGTITITGSLDGAARSETLTISGTTPKTGSYSFDSVSSITTTGLADEATKPNVKIACLDAQAHDITSESTTSILIRPEPHNKSFQGPGGVWTTTDTRIFSTASLEIGDIIRYGSRDYTVRDVSAVPWTDGSIKFYTYLCN